MEAKDLMVINGGNGESSEILESISIIHSQD